MGETKGRPPKESGGQTVKEREYAPTKLNNLHHEIVRRYVLGLKQVEIAEQLGCSKAVVNYVINSTPGMTKLEKLQENQDYDALQVAADIRRRAPDAIRTIGEIMLGDASESVKLRAAQDILDRAGHAPIKQVSVLSTTLSVSATQLAEIKQKAIERALALHDDRSMIDVTPGGD